MKIIDINQVPEFHNKTKSVESLGALLGKKAHVISEVVKTRRDLTLSILTDGLNRIYNHNPQKTSFQEINSFMFEWKIETNYIPRTTIVEDCSDDGANGAPITMYLENNYYSRNDTFALQNNFRWEFFVIEEPQKVADNRWQYIVILSGNNRQARLDPNLVRRGAKTIFHSNYHSEASYFGSSKFIYDIEHHRGWISTHRVAESLTGDFNAQVYFQAKGSKGEDRYFSMAKPEKRLLDQFMQVREHSHLFNRDNHTRDGKCLQTDPVTNHPIHRGDGVIAQIERYCDRFVYNTLSVSAFEDAIQSVVKRTGKTTGNNITVICNWSAWLQVQKTLANHLRAFANDGAYYYSQKANMEVSVGASFNSYNYAGNTITFAEDKVLSEHIEDKGYMIFIDTGINEDSKPNVMGFTIAGRDMIKGTLKGMGGMDGRTSGDISSPIDGVRMEILGQAGIAVLNPYAAFIMEEGIVG